ncbi:hypothetical protein FHT87_005907 [Rhizobium sp. BK316]|uniref:hypothetical protein n=1 Tax=Rhizobium sp. BK316 TaxID=2587053 RepID=UPI0016200C75|nr:hypothetical protein [Rhizobium sp. BK316]MBB3411940.1 hypothetical protein [Rhizobium sp. BK316]
MDILKPYLEKIAGFIWAQTVPLIGTTISLVLIWLYADIYIAAPLSRYEVIGFAIIIFLALWLACRLSRILIKAFLSFVIACLFLPLNHANADQLKIIDIPKGGVHNIDLAQLSLIRFKFPFSQLEMTDTPSTPEEKTKCLTYTRAGDGKFRATFCNYDKMFNSAVQSIISDSEGNTAYAFDLYDLYSGGGGNFGMLLDFPSTNLKDYQTANGLEIEALCRAFLPKRPNKKSYSGFGMYAFVLLRDRGVDASRKADLAKAYLSILPKFNSDSFGVPRSKLAVLVYPTNFSSDDIYQGFNAGGWDSENSNEISAIAKGYNYDFSTAVLKTIGKITKKNPPSMSIIFVKSNTGSMSIEVMDWDHALMLDISRISNYEKFFVDLNNYFVYGIEEPPPDIFTVARKFAESTGRLALIAFEGTK